MACEPNPCIIPLPEDLPDMTTIPAGMTTKVSPLSAEHLNQQHDTQNMLCIIDNHSATPCTFIPMSSQHLSVDYAEASDHHVF